MTLNIICLPSEFSKGVGAAPGEAALTVAFVIRSPSSRPNEDTGPSILKTYHALYVSEALS